MAIAQITEPKYEIKKGPLAKTYGLFATGTHNTGAHISADRIADEGLRRDYFYVSNVPFAVKRDGKLMLGISLTPSAFDIVYRTNTKDVCQGLINTGYIHLKDYQKNQVLLLERKGEVVFVDPKKMGLKGNEAEHRSFPIRTGAYEKDVTISRMPWIQVGYGSGHMLGKVMDNLKTNGKISETTVYTMNPEHVADNIGDDEMVARACWLDSFDYYSDFGANGRIVGNANGALRGVPLESAEGGEKISPLETLVGKGSIAHDDIAVVRQSDVSPEDWQLLTQR